MRIEFDRKGTILNSHNPKFIKIIDDMDNTGGFIILLSQNGNFFFPDCYDDWVENLETLKAYLQESAWVIKWS